MFDTLVGRITVLSEKQPDKPAVSLKNTVMTYRGLAENMRLAAAYLLDAGIGKGDRVLLSAVSKPETVAVFLGIQYIGAVAVLVDKNSSDESAAEIFRDTKASLFVSAKPMKKYADEFVHVLHKDLLSGSGTADNSLPVYKKPDPDVLSEIIYTTGTTGRPKGIMLTYGSVYHSMISVLNSLGICEDERYLMPLPISHSYALDTVRAVLYNGASLILQNGFMFAGDIMNSIDRYDCTAMSMVPSSIEILKAQLGERFSSVLGKLRFIKFGAGQFGIKQQREITELLPDTTIYNGWGSSETSTGFILNVTQKVRDGMDMPSIGKPAYGVTIEIRDENGEPMKSSSAESPGRLAVKSDMIMKGYWGQPELTAKTLSDGFVITNDLVYRDENGYVYLLGRADDIINVGGEKVSPAEIENAAEQYEGVKECACIGADDTERGLGQIPVLFAAADKGYSEEALKIYLSGRLERFKMPRKYILIPSIPRNRMQKTDRRALKMLYDEMISGKAENDQENDPVIQNILTRRSIRNFTDKSIPQDILDVILKAGYYAPSGHNMQTWRFTVIRGEDKIQRFRQTTAETAKRNGLSFYGFINPDTVILVSNDVRAVCSCEDASAALENMQLAAHALGIGSVWIGVLAGLRQHEPIKSLLDEYEIPDYHNVYGILNLGYPGAPGRLLAKRTDVIHYV